MRSIMASSSAIKSSDGPAGGVPGFWMRAAKASNDRGVT